MDKGANTLLVRIAFHKRPVFHILMPRDLQPEEGKMERKKISSSSIRSVGYDERGQLLEVEFNDGRINQYSGVSPEVHRRLMNSPSIVSYFRDHVEEAFAAKRVKG
jgi:hypothetical protein